MARWLGWELVLVLLPLALVYVFTFYRDQQAPSMGDVLGSGQALLIAIAWSGGSLRELRESAPHRRQHRELMTLVGTCFLLLSAATYGFVAAETLAGRLPTPVQRREVAMGSLSMLVFAGLSSMYAIGISTPPATDGGT
jgi:hypothetical protein